MLSELTRPRMGSPIMRSQSWRVRRAAPSPRRRNRGRPRREVDLPGRIAFRVGAVYPEAFRLEPLDLVRRVGDPARSPAIRSPPPRSWRPSGRQAPSPVADHHPAGPGALADAEQGAEVARVLDVLEDHHQPRVRAGRVSTGAGTPRPPSLRPPCRLGRAAISASARSGTTRNGTRWRWQASWISRAAARAGGAYQHPHDLVRAVAQGLADGVVAVEEHGGQTSMICCSFFAGRSDLADVAVVELLDLVEAAALVVLADRLVLLYLLELVVAFAARLADTGARVLGEIVSLLDDTPCGGPRSAAAPGCGSPCRPKRGSARDRTS